VVVIVGGMGSIPVRPSAPVVGPAEQFGLSYATYGVVFTFLIMVLVLAGPILGRRTTWRRPVAPGHEQARPQRPVASAERAGDSVVAGEAAPPPTRVPAHIADVRTVYVRHGRLLAAPGSPRRSSPIRSAARRWRWA
jgi:hypothetical protein